MHPGGAIAGAGAKGHKKGIVWAEDAAAEGDGAAAGGGAEEEGAAAAAAAEQSEPPSAGADGDEA